MKICAILFPATMLVPAGCSKEEVIDISRDLAIVVRVPADVDLGQRTPGDPGPASSQQIPRYLYFFTAYTSTEPAGQSSRVSAFSLSNLSPDSWTPTENATGTVVNYQRTVILPMPATDEVMLYAIASHDPIPDLQAEVEKVQGGEAIDEAYVANLKLSARQKDGSTTVSIADVYAGTGKLLTDKDQIDANAEIVCYHVAAKFDVMYNLSDDFKKGEVYGDWRVSVFTLKNLLPSGYYFKPAENAPGENETSTEYTFTANEGNNFYGRFDTYIFQPAPAEENALSFSWEVVLADKKGVEEERTLEHTSVVENFETEYATYFRLNVTVNGIGE